MGWTRREFLALASAGTVAGLAACSVPQQSQEQPAGSGSSGSSAEEPKSDVVLKEFEDLALDMSAWKYDKEHEVYYQLGVPYCLKPGSASLESLAIFVPGAYFKAEEKGDTYACTIDTEATVGNFTPATAPVVMPINSGTLSVQNCPTSYGYKGLGTYLDAGFVYVYAGFRGRSAGFESDSKEIISGGAPWPVVDLKAAVRFLRYNKDSLPCDTSRVFSFGFSMGGGIAAVLGSSGDSELYTPYLEQIGAITHDGTNGDPISDAIFGSASWCPITSFDTADAAYEWQMGQYSTDGTRADGQWTQLLSRDLAAAYAASVNSLDLRDSDDNALTLDETSGEIFTDGTYYNYMVDQVEAAAANFFQNTTFPYTYTPTFITSPSFPGDPNLQSSAAGVTDVEAVTGDASAQAATSSSTDATASGTATTTTTTTTEGTTTTTTTTSTPTGTTQVQSTVYNTVFDYVSALNASDYWLTYNQRRGTARIQSLGAFVRNLKPAKKGVCAFDAVDRSSVENQTFGIDDESTLHFSKTAAELIAQHIDAYSGAQQWDKKYVTEWGDDVAKEDALGTTVTTRVNMLNPLYFLSGGYDGFGTAGVAPHWRINSGLFQTDTSLCTEANLALALSHYDGVSDVAFTPVWGQGHMLAEQSGDAEGNLVAWVVACCAPAGSE